VRRAHAQERQVLQDRVTPPPSGELQLSPAQQAVSILAPFRIIKKTLNGPGDRGKNLHWAGLRVEMLEKLYRLGEAIELQRREREMATNTPVEDLLTSSQTLGWLTKGEFANTSALIIERIILRLRELGQFPKDVKQRVSNRIPEYK
jgi:hypothetical protein